MARRGLSLPRSVARALAIPDLRRFSRETFFLLVALGLFNGSNYLFHVVVSRLLGPSEYGALAALLAVVMVLSVPAGVLHTVIAQRTAALRANGRDEDVGPYAAATLKTLVPISVAAGLTVLLVGAPVLAELLHLSYASAALLGPYVTLLVLGSVPFGVLQGELRFGGIAALILSSVVVRLAVGIGLVAAGLGVPGAILATALAPAVGLALGLALLGPARRAWRAAARSGAHLRGSFGVALLALTSFWLLAQVDIVLARHFLPREEAGYYSAAGLLARALLFLPAAVSLVAFPRFVAARERGAGQLRWLRLGLGVSAGLIGGAVAVLLLLRGPLVELAFGASFLAGEELVPPLALGMAALALLNLLNYFHIAMGSRAYRLTFAAVAVEFLLILRYHDTPTQIAWIVAAVGAATAVLQYLAAASLGRWRPALERAGDAVPGLGLEPSLELSVVLPCRDAGGGLEGVLEALERDLEAVDSYELIVVSDGSTDETVAIAERFASDRVRILEYRESTGKGHALHVGLTEARGAYVAFLDGDGDIAPDALRAFLELTKLYDPDIVLGSKRHPLSEVYYPPLRRFLSWVYHKLTRLLFRVNVRDTQTGVKLIRRDVLQAVLPRLLEKRYAFDLEFLVVARALGYRRVFEAPVRIDYRFATQVDPGSAVRILLDTAAIFFRHQMLDTYRQAGTRLEGGAFPPGAPVPPERLGHVWQRRGRHGLTPRGLRILVLNWRDIRNPDAGGAEVFTHEVTRRWAAEGNDVTLLSSGFRGGRRSETIDGVRVRRIGRLRRGTFHLLAQRELARARDFDVVVDEINTIPFLTPLWRWRLPPVVAVIHQLAEDVWDAELPRPLSRVGRSLEPRLLRLYAETPFVTVSDSTRDDLHRLGLRDVSVVHDGVDAPPDLEGVEKEADPTYIYVGRLASNKRPDHAVQAFALIRRQRPEARLWIVGRGPLERRLAESLPEGATMLGHLPRAELYERMARAHCLLVPSVREGWGLVVIEANAVGTPAVGYDVPGIRDSVRHGATGLLAEAGDFADLARHAVELVRDEAGYEAMRKAAREWAAGFSWDTTSDELMAIVRRRLAHVPGDLGTAPEHAHGDVV